MNSIVPVNVDASEIPKTQNKANHTKPHHTVPSHPIPYHATLHTTRSTGKLLTVDINNTQRTASESRHAVVHNTGGASNTLYIRDQTVRSRVHLSRKVLYNRLSLHHT